MVQRKQEHPDRFYHAGCVASSWKDARVSTVALFARVLYLNAVDTDKTEHRPEQTKQRAGQPVNRTDVIVTVFKRPTLSK